MKNWNFISCLLKRTRRVQNIIICSIISVLLRSINYIKNLFWQPKLGLYITARSGSKSLELKNQVRSASQILEIFKKGLRKLWSYDWFRTLVYIILSILIIKIVIVVLHYFNICVSSELSYYIGWLLNKLIRRIIPEAHAGTEEKTPEEIRKHNLKIMKETSEKHNEHVKQWFISLLNRLNDGILKFSKEETSGYINFSTRNMSAQQVAHLKEVYNDFLGKDKELLKDYLIQKNLNVIACYFNVIEFLIKYYYKDGHKFAELKFFKEFHQIMEVERDLNEKFRSKFDGELFDYYCQINNSLYSENFWLILCEDIKVFDKKIADELLLKSFKYVNIVKAVFPYLIDGISSVASSIASSSSAAVVSESSNSIKVGGESSSSSSGVMNEKQKSASKAKRTASRAAKAKQASESSGTSYVVPETVASSVSESAASHSSTSSAWASSHLNSKSTIVENTVSEPVVKVDESSVENRVSEPVASESSSSNYVAPESSSNAGVSRNEVLASSSSSTFVLAESLSVASSVFIESESVVKVDESSVENRVLESVGTSASTYKARQRLVWELAKEIRLMQKKKLFTCELEQSKSIWSKIWGWFTGIFRSISLDSTQQKTSDNSSKITINQPKSTNHIILSNESARRLVGFPDIKGMDKRYKNQRKITND